MKTTNGERAGERLVQSRRSFIKAAGAAALGMAALGAAGCAAQNPQNDKAASANEIAWDEECDVLVVGAGAAGLATALTVATEGGGAKTLLLEKGSSELGNGNSIFSSGVIFTGDDSGRLFEYLKELRGGFTGTPDAILKAFADEMIHHREWLNGLGATDEQLIDYPSKAAEWSELPHADATSAIYFNKEDPDGMTHVVKFLDAALADHADTVTRLTEAPLTALVQDPETKQVLGGVYEHRSKSVYVKATKGVVMTCGGFENDDVMKQDYLSYPKSHPAAGLCNTGDGHRICGELLRARYRRDSHHCRRRGSGEPRRGHGISQQSQCRLAFGGGRVGRNVCGRRSGFHVKFGDGRKGARPAVFRDRPHFQLVDAFLLRCVGIGPVDHEVGIGGAHVLASPGGSAVKRELEGDDVAAVVVSVSLEGYRLADLSLDRGDHKGSFQRLAGEVR